MGARGARPLQTGLTTTVAICVDDAATNQQPYICMYIYIYIYSIARVNVLYQARQWCEPYAPPFSEILKPPLVTRVSVGQIEEW